MGNMYEEESTHSSSRVARCTTRLHLDLYLLILTASARSFACSVRCSILYPLLSTNTYQKMSFVSASERVSRLCDICVSPFRSTSSLGAMKRLLLTLSTSFERRFPHTRNLAFCALKGMTIWPSREAGLWLVCELAEKDCHFRRSA